MVIPMMNYSILIDSIIIQINPIRINQIELNRGMTFFYLLKNIPFLSRFDLDVVSVISVYSKSDSNLSNETFP